MNLNQVNLAGRLCRDPELKFLPKGTAICQTSIAINRKWKDDNGEAKEEVTFVELTLWGKTAESFAQYQKKGSAVFVTGRLKTDSWEDKTTGQKRSKLTVTVDNWQFVGSKSDSPTGPAAEDSRFPAAATREPKPLDPLNGPAKAVEDEDDVPF